MGLVFSATGARCREFVYVKMAFDCDRSAKPRRNVFVLMGARIVQRRHDVNLPDDGVTSAGGTMRYRTLVSPRALVTGYRHNSRSQCAASISISRCKAA